MGATAFGGVRESSRYSRDLGGSMLLVNGNRDRPFSKIPTRVGKPYYGKRTYVQRGTSCAAVMAWRVRSLKRIPTHGGSQGLHGQRVRGPGGAATQGAAVTQRDTHAAGEATHARGEGAAQGGKVRACAVSPSAGGSGAVPTTAARVRVPTQGSQARRPHSTERARAQVGQPRTKPQPVGGDHRAGGCVGRAWYAQLQGLRMLGVPAAMLTGVCACGCLVVVTAPRPGCVHRAPAKGHAQWAAVLREGVV